MTNYRDSRFVSGWSVAAEVKWKELFKSFLNYDLGISDVIGSELELDEAASITCHATVWNCLVTSMVKIRSAASSNEIR